MEAATATRMTTVATELVSREVPAAVDVSGTDPTGGRDARALAVRGGGKAAVVRVRLELVLHRRVVEQPEEILRVAGGHQDGEAAGQGAGGRAGPGTTRRRPDPEDVHVAEHGPHHRGAGALAKRRCVDGGQHRDAVPDLDVAADADLFAGGDRHRDPALGNRQVGDIAGAEEVAGRGDQVGGYGAVARDVDAGAFAGHVPDVGEVLRRSGIHALEREVRGLDQRARLDVVAGDHDPGAACGRLQ